MAEIAKDTDTTSLNGDRITGKEKLERIKAQLFPSSTKAFRVAQALEALQKAIQPSHLDTETLKIIAQDADLEGF